MPVSACIVQFNSMSKQPHMLVFSESVTVSEGVSDRPTSLETVG